MGRDHFILISYPSSLALEWILSLFEWLSNNRDSNLHLDLQHSNDEEKFALDSIEEDDFYNANNMSMFPSIWELDWDEVVRKKFQTHREDNFERFYEGTEIDRIFFNEDLYWDNYKSDKNSQNEEFGPSKDTKMYESTGAFIPPKQEERSFAKEAFTEEKNKSLLKEEEKEKIKKNVKSISDTIKDSNFDFTSRVRFSKEHDRGKT